MLISYDRAQYPDGVVAFTDMLAGGHPNSLGRTVEVVALVLSDEGRLGELFDCYRSDDAVVRLRTSNAMKRVEAERHDLLVPYLDRLIDEVGRLDQDSARWTLAQLFGRLAQDMSSAQTAKAVGVMKRNLTECHDWIVLKATMETLADWSKGDASLRDWLRPHLDRLAQDPRKTVAGRARTLLEGV